MPIIVGGFLTALAFTITGALPALASNGVTQNITAGVLSGSVGDLALSDVIYSNSAQTTTGSLLVSADDSTGAALGWHVTLQASSFVYSGIHVGTAFPAASLAITGVSAPILVSGQAVNATAATGPEVPPTSPVGTLDSARSVISATAGYGTGSYTEALAVALTIPAGSKIGTYAGTITTTISIGA
ncbi:MAG TPA: hypothetical protein VG015_00870 [Candidatus Dormibacteraeota bacterium]|nr:hypothetical protein [Candidatus Dormibacteraeota bacterium]